MIRHGTRHVQLVGLAYSQCSRQLRVWRRRLPCGKLDIFLSEQGDEMASDEQEL